MMMLGPSFLGMMFLTFGTGLFAGSSILGLPPGERDGALLRCAPAEAVLYAEWAERGPGKEGGPGIEGLVADPEVKAFFGDVERAITNSLQAQTQNAGPAGEFLSPIALNMPKVVKTLGNRPGCLYVDVDAEALAAAQGKLQEAGPGGGGPEARMVAVFSGIDAALVVNGGTESDALAKALSELLVKLPEPPSEELQKVKFPLPPGLSLTLHREGEHFILGFGEGSVERAVAGLEGKSEGLKGNPRFTAAMKRVEVGKMSGVSWLDVKRLVETLTQALGPAGPMVQKTAADSGLDKVESVAGWRGMIEGQIHSRTFIKTDGQTEGLLALAAGRGIAAADLAKVPEDADFVFALSLDLPKILASTRDIIAKAHPPSQQVFEQTLKQLETELEISLEKDFFQGFGDVWTIYNSKSAGGLFVSSLVGSLEVRDAEKAEKVFGRAMEVLRNSLPGDTTTSQYRVRGVHLVHREFMGRTIYFVNTVGDDDVPVAPAFCLTEKELLIGPHPQAIKSHLRFLKSEQANFSGRLKELAGETEGELVCVTHFDTKSLVRYLYALSPYFGQVIFSEMQSHGVDLTVFSLPSARAVLPYVGNSVSTVSRTEEGILFAGQTALPVPVFSIAAANLPMVFWMVQMRALGELDQPREAPAAVEGDEEGVKASAATVKPAGGPVRRWGEGRLVPSGSFVRFAERML